MTANKNKPTVVDLFCGAGGLSLGFQAAGCRILAGVDFDEMAGKTFSRNFLKLQEDAPPKVMAGDEGNLEELSFSSLLGDERPDILIGGPPCQGFSRIGRAKLDSLTEEGFADDPRNELYRRFLGAANFWQPQAVVMENVPGMLSVQGRNVANEAAADLENLGYEVGYAVLNVVWYGVPQYRERLFLIGLRRDLKLKPVMPIPSHIAELPGGYIRPALNSSLTLAFIKHFELPVELQKGSFPATTTGDALDDLPELTEHLYGPPPRLSDFRQRREYKKTSHTSYARLMRTWPGLPQSECVFDHAIRKTPRDYETFKRMKPGDRYPEALRIANERFQEELTKRGPNAPVPGSAGYRELEQAFVPPYPVDKFVDKWRKLVYGNPSWTIPAHLSKDAYSHIHYDSEQGRAISIREAARIQSFPDSFAFEGNMGDCFRQIGNAVPPLMSWAIAHQLLKILGVPTTLPAWK
jgi:DNA (cytosine-5)-methyltransferase 1